MLARLFACRVVSGKKSVQYGVRLSYPIQISLIAMGVLMVNPYILTFMALISFLSLFLPMHPFDYLYNIVISKLIGTHKIPGRGSELPVSSSITLLFILTVIAMMHYGAMVNYQLIAILYIVSSVFFIIIQLSSKGSHS